MPRGKNLRKYALRVPKEKGSKTIEKLRLNGFYDNSRDILKEGESLWIPVRRPITGAEAKNLPIKNSHLASLKSSFGIGSFDIIGDIIVLFIPAEKTAQKNEIGNYLLKLYPSVKAVFMETQKAKGDFRIQAKELIAGSGSETIHRENDMQFRLDVTKVFFSPRQITERLELTKRAEKNDTVCVFFSGIGAIPIYLSKLSKAKTITAIELNPIAHDFATENLLLNNVTNVRLISGDVRQVVQKITKKHKFDFIVMPLPKGSNDFLELAHSALKKKGRLAISFVGSSPQLDALLNSLKEKNFLLRSIKKERSVASKEYRYSLFAQRS